MTYHGVAVFKGYDLLGKSICIATKGEWSHVGLVLRDEMGQKYCFEATGSAGEIIHNNIFPQVQIRFLDDVLNKYDGKVAMREFYFENGKEPDESIVKWQVLSLVGLPYEKNFKELLRAIENKNRKESDNSLFCSELVAKCLIESGYLSDNRTANNYIPKDYSEEYHNLSLISASFGPQKILKE